MNWMSVFQLVIMFASAAIAWIVFYYVKELPKFHKDYLRDFREAKRELEKTAGNSRIVGNCKLNPTFACRVVIAWKLCLKIGQSS